MDVLHLEIGYILLKFSLDNISYSTFFLFLTNILQSLLAYD